jgi:hypothetical protein
MIIKKDTLLQVNHSRKGQYMAIALKDFDNETEEFYPLAIATIKQGGNGYGVGGLYTDAKWKAGDEIPSRRSLCTIKIINVETMKDEM